jgi:hypothetical protein
MVVIIKAEHEIADQLQVGFIAVFRLLQIHLVISDHFLLQLAAEEGERQEIERAQQRDNKHEAYK